MSDESIDKSPEQIFNSAADIDSPEERSAYLDRACGDDGKLRAEVEELLRHDADAGSFLEKPPEELEVTVGSDLSGADSDEAWRDVLTSSEAPDCIGTLGPYEVVELIGRGGMGVVLRARDPKLNRIVAIKLLAPELAANPMSVRRFLREAQAAAAVSHDHVVTIHAIDEQARPPVIVMEFIDGQSLQQRIDAEGALDVKSILRIGMQTAAGLTAAHRQGLMHRDIKPSNILLENGIERVKLTDFGLARAVDDIAVTRTGQITGTPQYMSPEQAQGHRLDHRTDLFSLGCVLYAMCTGRAAFRADSAVAVMHRVVHDSPRPIREINEDIPVWLREIVEKLLAKDVADRFESANNVEELLSRHLAHLQQPESVPQPERVGPTQGMKRQGVASERERTSAERPPVESGAPRHWLRRVPIPAWIAVLLFLMVFVTAIVEWTGQQEAASRGNGVLFYLLGTGFVLAWGACSLATRIIRGPDAARSSLPPSRTQIVGFFTVVILLMGLFVWQWAELSNKADRDQVLGFFFGHGSITLALGDPNIEVEFNSQPVEVPADGRVVLRPDWPGSFLTEIHRNDGSIGRSEMMIHSGMNAEIGSGVFSNATRVVVTGPIEIVSTKRDIDYSVKPINGQLTFSFEGIKLVFEGTSGIDPLSGSTGRISAAGGRALFFEMVGNAVRTSSENGLPGVTAVTVNDYTFQFTENATRLRLQQPTDGVQNLNLAGPPRPLTILIAADGSHRIE